MRRRPSRVHFDDDLPEQQQPNATHPTTTPPGRIPPPAYSSSTNLFVISRLNDPFNERHPPVEDEPGVYGIPAARGASLLEFGIAQQHFIRGEGDDCDTLAATDASGSTMPSYDWHLLDQGGDANLEELRKGC